MTLNIIKITRDDTISRKRHFWPNVLMLLIVCIAALCLRVVCVDKSIPWADELFSMAMATGHSLSHPRLLGDEKLGDYIEPESPVSPTYFEQYYSFAQEMPGPSAVIRAAARSDFSPPGYYLVLYTWFLFFGTTPIALRSLSIACSLFALIYTWSLCRRWHCTTFGTVIACVLFAISPTAVEFSVEGRMYALGWLIALMLVDQTWQISLHPNKRRNLLFWFVTAAIGCMIQGYMLFIVAACTLWLLMYTRSRQRLAVLSSAIVSIVPSIVWYSTVLKGWRVGGEWLNGLVSWPTLLRTPYWNYLFYLSGEGVSVSIAKKVALFPICLMYAWICKISYRRPLLTKVHLLLSLPILSACVLPLFLDLLRNTHTSTIPRYALAAMPLAFIQIGWVLGRAHRGAAIAVLLLLGYLWMPAGNNLIRDVNSSAYASFRQINQPRDLVVIEGSPAQALSTVRFLPADARVWARCSELHADRYEGDQKLFDRFDRILILPAGANSPVTKFLLEHNWHERKLPYPLPENAPNLKVLLKHQ